MNTNTNEFQKIEIRNPLDARLDGSIRQGVRDLSLLLHTPDRSRIQALYKSIAWELKSYMRVRRYRDIDEEGQVISAIGREIEGFIESLKAVGCEKNLLNGIKRELGATLFKDYRTHIGRAKHEIQTGRSGLCRWKDLIQPLRSDFLRHGVPEYVLSWRYIHTVVSYVRTHPPNRTRPASSLAANSQRLADRNDLATVSARFLSSHAGATQPFPLLFALPGQTAGDLIRPDVTVDAGSDDLFSPTAAWLLLSPDATEPDSAGLADTLLPAAQAQASVLTFPSSLPAVNAAEPDSVLPAAAPSDDLLLDTLAPDSPSAPMLSEPSPYNSLIDDGLAGVENTLSHELDLFEGLESLSEPMDIHLLVSDGDTDPLWPIE